MKPTENAHRVFIKLLPKGYIDLISAYINHSVKPRMIRKILQGVTPDHYGIMDYALLLAKKEKKRREELAQQIKRITSGSFNI